MEKSQAAGTSSRPDNRKVHQVSFKIITEERVGLETSARRTLRGRVMFAKLCQKATNLTNIFAIFIKSINQDRATRWAKAIFRAEGELFHVGTNQTHI